ncbi:M23 family metallopeptidase [Candidatus Dependentiae bacterium]
MGVSKQLGNNLENNKRFYKKLKGEKIRYSFKFLSKLIFIFFMAILCVLSCFLYYEYSFFKKQSSKMLELQQDYRTYIGAVNKILSDYNTVKEKLEEQSCKSCQFCEPIGVKSSKKKNKLDDVYFYTDFQKNFHENSCQEFCVISSADNYLESFFVVSRDLDCLRDSALIFINTQDDSNAILDGIDWSDWCEYTDYGLSKISVSDTIRKRAKEVKSRPKKARTIAPKLKKTKKVSCYASLNSPVRSVPRKKTGRTGIIERSGIRLSWPIERSRFWISSLYGPRKKRSGAWGFHYGVDMAALKGTPVCAAYTGIVLEARYASGYGNTIVVAHSRKYKTRYAHLSKILVKVGQKVRRGKIIGRVGDTGYVRSSKGRDASHLHFELIEFGKKINPLPFISHK